MDCQPELQESQGLTTQVGSGSAAFERKISEQTYLEAKTAYIESPVPMSARDIATAFGISHASVEKRMSTEQWVGLRDAHQLGLANDKRPLDMLPYDVRTAMYQKWDDRHLRGVQRIQEAILLQAKRGMRDVVCPDCKGKGFTGRGQDKSECRTCRGSGGILRELLPSEWAALVTALKGCMDVERRVHNRDLPLRSFDGLNSRGGNVNILVNNPAAGVQLAQDATRLSALEQEAGVVDAVVEVEGAVNT